jgi:hypothetical protein
VLQAGPVLLCCCIQAVLQLVQHAQLQVAAGQQERWLIWQLQVQGVGGCCQGTAATAQHSTQHSIVYSRVCVGEGSREAAHLVMVTQQTVKLMAATAAPTPVPDIPV